MNSNMYVTSRPSSVSSTSGSEVAVVHLLKTASATSEEQTQTALHSYYYNTITLLNTLLSIICISHYYNVEQTWHVLDKSSHRCFLAISAVT